MDSNDDNEVDNYYIHSDDKGFEFYNVATDEWIDSLQVDFSIGQILYGASDSDNERRISSDEDDIDV
jgi:hypothetical protein